MSFKDLFLILLDEDYKIDRKNLNNKENKQTRIIKQKTEYTIDQVYDYWVWVLKFCKTENRSCVNCPKPYVDIHNFNIIKIHEFQNFCDYIIKYKNVRII